MWLTVNNQIKTWPPKSNLLQVGNVYCRHLKATLVEAWTATQLLNYLHHHPLQRQTYVLFHLASTSRMEREIDSGETYLSVGFTACFICLAEVEHQFVSTFLTQLLYYVEGAFAEGLTHRVKEHKYQIGLLSCTEKEKRNEKRRAPTLEETCSYKAIPNHVMALLTSKG